MLPLLICGLQMLISFHIHGSIILLRVFVIYYCLCKGHLAAICTATSGCKQEFVLLTWNTFMDCCANLSKCLLERQLFEISLPDGGTGLAAGQGGDPGCCVQLWVPRTGGTGSSWGEAKRGCRDEEGTGEEEREVRIKHQTKYQHNVALKLSRRLSSDVSSSLNSLFSCLKT